MREVLKKYYIDWPSISTISDEELRNIINKQWLELEQGWFINYLNDKIKDNSLDLNVILNLLKDNNLELNLFVLANILKKCPNFDDYLAKLINKDKTYTLEQLERYSASEILILYATLKDLLIEEEDEINYKELNVSDSEKMYLSEIHNIPVLSWEKTKEYFEKIEEYKKLLANEENPELIHKYEEKIQMFKNKIVEGNLRLIIRPATRYLNNGIDLLDLIQEGNIGLMRATEYFDLHVGVKFSTYAMWWVRQAFQRAIVDKGRMIRIPVHGAEKIKKIKREKDNLEQELGREVNLNELVEYLNISDKALINYMINFDNLQSLDKSYGTEDDDSNAYEFTPSEENIEKDILDKIMVESILKKLNEREEEFIRLRFGIKKDEKDTLHSKTHTLAQIGEIFGITRERARQREIVALKKLVLYAKQSNVKLGSVGNHKLFFEEFPDVGKTVVLKYFNKLRMSEKNLLQKRYGMNLDSFNKVDKNTYYAVNNIIFKLQSMIKKGTLGKEEKEIPEPSLKNFVSPFKAPIFKTLIKCVPEDLRFVTNLSLGIEDGRLHSAREIADYLFEDEEVVKEKRNLGIRIFVKVLDQNQDLCKEYLPNFSENVGNVLQLIRG